MQGADWYSIDIPEMLHHLALLALSFLLALPVAWDRERAERTLGLRTFPLVAMASAGYVLIAQSVLVSEPGELSRVIQGLLTGVGFLGGGAIVKRGMTVHGTATAASIWSTAAVGVAVAVGRFEIAIALTLANFATLRWLGTLKPMVGNATEAKDETEEEVSGDAGR